jgi:predicted nucleotidyltransferase
LNSVVIKSINRDQIRRSVLNYAAQLRKQHPEIERIIWFGSWVSGLPSPGSDVDICLLLSESNTPVHDRVSVYLPVGFPVGVDLCVYTMQEFQELKRSSPGWYAAITSGENI